MPQAPDLYGLLGVSRDASQDEIRKAYLKLAHKYHPDKTGGDKEAEDKLKEINMAYDILKNPEKRAKFDRFGSTDAGGGFGGGGGGGFDGGFEDLSDLFGTFFGGSQGGGGGGRRARGGVRPQAGNDLELRLNITLEEAFTGTSKTVRFNRQETCGDCSGSGAAPGTTAETCQDCGGAGQVRAAHGFFSVTRACPRCHGRGKSIASPCRNCQGAGRSKKSRELSVDVPAGVDTNSQLRVSGEGEPGANGGPRGNLYIAIHVEPDDRFEREDTTIVCVVPISFTQAALGDTIRVPTLQGEAELKVPAGSQSDSQLRLRGMGMPDLRGYRQGDQIVILNVETPTKLNKRQKELLKEFDEEGSSKNYPLYRRFMDSFK